jgi:hypothetical protein
MASNRWTIATITTRNEDLVNKSERLKKETNLKFEDIYKAGVEHYIKILDEEQEKS